MQFGIGIEGLLGFLAVAAADMSKKLLKANLASLIVAVVEKRRHIEIQEEASFDTEDEMDDLVFGKQVISDALAALSLKDYRKAYPKGPSTSAAASAAGPKEKKEKKEKVKKDKKEKAKP